MATVSVLIRFSDLSERNNLQKARIANTHIQHIQTHSLIHNLFVPSSYLLAVESSAIIFITHGDVCFSPAGSTMKDVNRDLKPIWRPFSGSDRRRSNLVLLSLSRLLILFWDESWTDEGKERYTMPSTLANSLLWIGSFIPHLLFLSRLGLMGTVSKMDRWQAY